MHAQRSGEIISKRTKDAMAKQKAEGTTFGNPDILNIQRHGAIAVSVESDALVKTITEVLRSIPEHEKLSRAEIADYLNTRGIVTGSGLPWEVSRVTGSLRKARSMLEVERSAEADAAARAHPDFGGF